MSSTTSMGNVCAREAIRDLNNFLCSITNPAYFDWYKVRDMGAHYGVVVHVKIGNNKYLYRISTAELVDSHGSPESWATLTVKIDEWVGALVGQASAADQSPKLFVDAIDDSELSSLTFKL